jgi:hypothetical protein
VNKLELVRKINEQILNILFSSVINSARVGLITALGAPKGRPKYFIVNKATLHPIIHAKLPTSSTSPTGIIFDFDKFIFNLDTASRQKK